MLSIFCIILVFFKKLGSRANILVDPDKLFDFMILYQKYAENIK